MTKFATIAAAVAALPLLLGACVHTPDKIAETERLTANHQTRLAAQYAREAATGLDTMSQERKCRLAVACFRLSERLNANHEEALADSVLTTFRTVYSSSLSPDTTEAFKIYMQVNLHVPALFQAIASGAKK